jgi:hypothetical protein
MTMIRQPLHGQANAADAALRVRRAILIGTLASFVGFFGLSVVATSPSEAADTVVSASNGVTVVCGPEVCEPVLTHVRTRTS